MQTSIPAHAPLRKVHSAYEKLLYKVIIQFALYAQNFDAAFGDDIMEIRGLLKDGFQKDKMQEELQRLSTKLAMTDCSGQMCGDGRKLLIFDYLKSMRSDAGHIAAIENIQQRYEAGEFEADDALFDAIRLATVESTAQDQARPCTEQRNFISEQLLFLFEKIDIPPDLYLYANALKNKISRPLPDADIKSVMKDSVRLLINILNKTGKDQQIIEKYLAEIAEQLNNAGQKAMHASQTAQSSIDQQEVLTSVINQHVEDIRGSALGSREKTSARDGIDRHLAVITEKLREHQEQEQQRQLEMKRQLDEMADRLKEMEQEADTLKSNLKLAHDQALHDPLTGLPNRAAYDERLALEMARRKRYGKPLSLLVWDIDHFKAINDTYGHKSGDKALCLIAQLLRSNCRETDFVSRFGGEEFVMLLPGSTAENALRVANKIREVIGNATFSAFGKAISITISCGISEFKEGDSEETVFERTDQALYQAKENGRNCCVIG